MFPIIFLFCQHLGWKIILIVNPDSKNLTFYGPACGIKPRNYDVRGAKISYKSTGQNQQKVTWHFHKSVHVFAKTSFSKWFSQ